MRARPRPRVSQSRGSVQTRARMPESPPPPSAGPHPQSAGPPDACAGTARIITDGDAISGITKRGERASRPALAEKPSRPARIAVSIEMCSMQNVVPAESAFAIRAFRVVPVGILQCECRYERWADCQMKRSLGDWERFRNTTAAILLGLLSNDIVDRTQRQGMIVSGLSGVVGAKVRLVTRAILRVSYDTTTKYDRTANGCDCIVSISCFPFCRLRVGAFDGCCRTATSLLSCTLTLN